MSKIINQKIIPLMNQIFLILFTIILKPFFFLNKKEIHFFSDRPFGIDNAFFQYQFSKKTNKNIISIYLCDNKKDQIYKNLENDKGIVLKKTFRHLWYFIHSSKIIISFDTYPFYFNSIGVYFKRLLKPNAKLIFLQHWVIGAKIPTYCKKNTFFDLFICSSNNEKKCIKDWSWYSQKEIALTWLPRFDNLYNFLPNTDKIILFMPTWNKDLLWLSEASFKKTSYYQNINSFLNSREIHDMLNKTWYMIYYVFHQKLNFYSELFNSEHNNVVIIKNLEKKWFDFPSLIKKSTILITNYSSISFDFGYMKKPLIYRHFSEYHYMAKYFNYEKEWFWKVVKTQNNLFIELRKIIKNKAQIEKKYRKNSKKYFYKVDDKNCNRVNQKILQL